MHTPQDAALLQQVVQAVQAAGQTLLNQFSPAARPASRSDMFAAGTRNEALSEPILREALAAARPGAGWVEEEMETGALPDGEWWVVDAVEGNVNHVHGMGEWCVSVTLLRDQKPVLAAIRQPIADLTYTAIAGAGAFVNGHALHCSPKSDMDCAIVATGQAEAEQADTYDRIAHSIRAMLGQALLVRTTVPSTFPMLQVASGQNDVFWQVEPVLPGVAAGALFVTEAGGRVSRMDGTPWQPGARDIVVSAPGLHGEVLRILAGI